MTLRVQAVGEAEYPAMYAILVICGEHMSRTLGLTHWYPFRSLEDNRRILDIRYLYAIYDDAYLIGTFNFNEQPRPYYKPELWAKPDARALYFGGLGILPAYQGRGTGQWAMQEADRITRELGFEVIRFDAVANHPRLLSFYERLGYQRRATVSVSSLKELVCFERDLT